MQKSTLLEQARLAAGLSQEELARRAGTSRPTISAYEHGRKSPTLTTIERLLAETGFELVVRPMVEFAEYPNRHGHPAWVPNSLPRLNIEQALARVVLPLHLNWSEPGREFDLSVRGDRARVYEIVLREGRPEDIRAYVDGALLVDLWDDLVLPRTLRAAWKPVISSTLARAA